MGEKLRTNRGRPGVYDTRCSRRRAVLVAVTEAADYSSHEGMWLCGTGVGVEGVRGSVAAAKLVRAMLSAQCVDCAQSCRDFIIACTSQTHTAGYCRQCVCERSARQKLRLDWRRTCCGISTPKTSTGKYEVLVPVGIPNEGTFSFLDLVFYPGAQRKSLLPFLPTGWAQ